MERNDEIEMLLWEYIDGTCSEADMQRISILVERDEMWKQKYKELTTLQTAIAASLQPEQPSMRFTKNVMEAVAASHIAPATKKYINMNVPRSIAAFFIISIIALLGYSLATADWHSGTNIISLPTMNFESIRFGNYFNSAAFDLFNSSTFNIIIAVNLALALLLLDGYLRRKRKYLSPTLSKARPAKPFGREEEDVK